MQLLSTTIENALLCLYISVSNSTGFVPFEKRNLIISRFLKPKLKDSRYKSIKKELKQILIIARASNGNLEDKLWELNMLSLKHVQKLDDATKLFDQLNYLHDTHDIDAKLFTEQQPDTPEENVIYVLPEHIEHCFDNNGIQIAPLSLFIHGAKAAALPNLINGHSLFFAELKEFNDSRQQAHILLHPLSNLTYSNWCYSYITTPTSIILLRRNPWI